VKPELSILVADSSELAAVWAHENTQRGLSMHNLAFLTLLLFWLAFGSFNKAL